MPPRRHSSLHLKPCPPWSLNLADLHHQWGLVSQSGIFYPGEFRLVLYSKLAWQMCSKDINYSGWRTQLYIYIYIYLGTSNFHAATKLIEKVHNSLDFATLGFSELHPAMFPIVTHFKFLLWCIYDPDDFHVRVDSLNTTPTSMKSTCRRLQLAHVTLTCYVMKPWYVR